MFKSVHFIKQIDAILKKKIFLSKDHEENVRNAIGSDRILGVGAGSVWWRMKRGRGKEHKLMHEQVSLGT